MHRYTVTKDDKDYYSTHYAKLLKADLNLDVEPLLRPHRKLTEELLKSSGFNITVDATYLGDSEVKLCSWLSPATVPSNEKHRVQYTLLGGDTAQCGIKGELLQ